MERRDRAVIIFLLHGGGVTHNGNLDAWIFWRGSLQTGLVGFGGSCHRCIDGRSSWIGPAIGGIPRSDYSLRYIE
jgi:hypothetical protein